MTHSDAQDNRAFWATVKSYLVRNPQVKVDMLLGNFNAVEEPVDRIPMSRDPQEASDALADARALVGLHDGWRLTFPDQKAFTFLQYSTGSQLKLDRIYVSPDILHTGRQCKIDELGIPGTDHRLVSMDIVHVDAPIVGKGQQSTPKHVTKDKWLSGEIRRMGIERLEEMKEAAESRLGETNPQTIYSSFKTKLVTLARDRDKAIIPTFEKRWADLQKMLDDTNHDERLPENDRLLAAAELTTRLQILEQQCHRSNQKHSAVKNRIEGETICKYWTKLNKEVTPMDMIYALKKELPPGFPPSTTPTYETLKYEFVS